MTKCKYQPLFGRVVIEREVMKKSTGGIIIPESGHKRHAKAEGKVIAVGPNTEGVKIGDKVIFGKHSGVWLDLANAGVNEDDGTLFLCQDEDILAIIQEP